MHNVQLNKLKTETVLHEKILKTTQILKGSTITINSMRSWELLFIQLSICGREYKKKYFETLDREVPDFIVIHTVCVCGCD